MYGQEIACQTFVHARVVSAIQSIGCTQRGQCGNVASLPRLNVRRSISSDLYLDSSAISGAASLGALNFILLCGYRVKTAPMLRSFQQRAIASGAM
jgi:hypothetical protein